MSSWIWRAFLAFGAALVAIFLVAHGLTVPLWGLAHGGAAIAVISGIRWHRPADTLPWTLIAVTLVLFGFGDVVQELLPEFTFISDSAFVVSYGCLTVALLRFVHNRTTGRDLPALLDALALTTALGLLAWVTIMAPYARDASLPLDQKLSAIAFPLADVVLLAVLLRLWSGGGARRAPYYLFGVAVLGTLVSDLAFAWVTLEGTYASGTLMDVGWLTFAATVGAAALHPAMATLSAPTRASALRPSRARMGLLAAASLVAPAVLVAEWVLDRPVDVPVIAGACVVLFLVTLFRMFWLASEVTRQDERKHMLGRVLQATEEERTRIATDLHDGPVQALAVLSYNAHRARRKLGNGDAVAADELMAKVEGSLEEEVRVLRRLMSDLRPPVLDNRGLAPALSEQVSNFQREHQVEATVEVELTSRLAPELETVLYRVVQESLNNIAKHAGAQRVRVEVAAGNGTVNLRVRDDGAGFQMGEELTLLKGGHYGLAGMRERVAMAGGTLNVVSAPGNGTTIQVALPVQVHQDA